MDVFEYLMQQPAYIERLSTLREKFPDADDQIAELEEEDKVCIITAKEKGVYFVKVAHRIVSKS